MLRILPHSRHKTLEILHDCIHTMTKLNSLLLPYYSVILYFILACDKKHVDPWPLISHHLRWFSDLFWDGLPHWQTSQRLYFQSRCYEALHCVFVFITYRRPRQLLCIPRMLATTESSHWPNSSQTIGRRTSLPAETEEQTAQWTVSI